MGLIAPLIKAIQDQQEQIEELQSKNKEFEHYLNTLERKNSPPSVPRARHPYNQ